MRKLLLVLLLSVSCLAQTTRKIPSTSTDNVWTGTNTFNGAVTITGGYVNLTTNQTAAGNKTFSGSTTFNGAAVFNGSVTLPGFVDTTTNQSVAGTKTFTGHLTGSFTGTYTGAVHQTYIESLLNGCSPSTEWNATQGTHSTDGLVGCIASPNTAVDESNAVAGYASGSNSAPAVGGFFQGRCVGNGCNVWGLNAVVQDVNGLTPGSLIGLDVNINPRNGSGVYTGGVGGVNVALDANIAGTYGSAYTSQKFGGGTGSWVQSFNSASGATDVALVAGYNTSAAPNASQNIYLYHRDAGSVSRLTTINVNSSGDLILTPYSGNTTLPSTGTVSLGKLTLAGVGGIAVSYPDGTAMRSGVAAGNMYLDVGTLNVRDGNGNTSGGSLVVAKQVTVNGGFSQGAGVKHQRFGATTATAATAGSSTTNTFSWTSAFADANYTVNCIGVNPTGTPDLSLSAVPIAASVTVKTTAITAVASSFAAVDCFAVHD